MSNQNLPKAGWETISREIGHCGAFSWKVRWLLDNPAPDLGNGVGGYIIQRVDIFFDIHERPFPNGRAMPRDEVRYKLGYDRDWFPYWEAFGPFRAGERTLPHDDLFSNRKPNVGADYGTWGRLTMRGIARFVPWLRLPPQFSVRDSSPAGPFPMTMSEPDLSDGAEPVARSITLKWDCSNGAMKSEIVEEGEGGL